MPVHLRSRQPIGPPCAACERLADARAEERRAFGEELAALWYLWRDSCDVAILSTDQALSFLVFSNALCAIVGPAVHDASFPPPAGEAQDPGDGA